MNISDKLLLAVLKTVPKEQESLPFPDFQQELEKMGVSQNSPQYEFFFSNDLIAINETQFVPMMGSTDFRIKVSDSLKYVYLTDQGQVLLWSLQAEFLREQFERIGR